MSAPHRMAIRRGKYQANEQEALVLPQEWNPVAQATNKLGVVVVHGRGALFEQFVTPPYAERIVYALADAGYPVMVIDAGGTDTWGNDAAQTALGNAIARMQGAAVGAGLSGVHLLGFSMGGLLILNYARSHASSIRSLVAICPVVDLAYEHDNNVNGYAAGIETAYTNLAGYTAAVATHDPMQNASTHASGPPIMMPRSSNDTSAPTARQDAFATAVGSNLTKVDLGAVGHTPATVDPVQALAFVEAHP